MGIFQKLRAKAVTSQYDHQLKAWQEQRDAYAKLLDEVKNYTGETSSDLVLKKGESVFAKVAGASLIEDRAAAGHWEGHSSGVSIPVGSIGGRTVRYHVGASRGHFVQSTPTPTAIDTGTLFVTNQRAVFVGSRQTRECAFAKLVSFQHDDKAGTTVFSVSNRQKPTIVHYGPKVSGWFDFQLDLALAHYRGEIDGLVSQMLQELAALDARKPLSPQA